MNDSINIDVSPSLNPELHKAIFRLVGDFDISMNELGKAVFFLQSKQPAGQSTKPDSIEDIHTSILKNREVINKNLHSLNKE